MNSFQKSLDRYLTAEPDFGFDGWCEKVIDLFTEETFNENEDWFVDGNGLCNKWMNKLFNTKTEEQAALIIERAFNIYIKNKKNA